MKGCFKIIELENHDVLVQRLSDYDNGEHIRITVVFEGHNITMKPSYDNDKKKADEAFENYNEKSAAQIVESTIEMFNGAI